MHDIDRTQLESNNEAYESGESAFELEMTGEAFEGPFNESELNELAMELLSVQNEQELDQFLGSLIKRAGSAIGKFARGPVGKALGGVLRSAAKAALPTLGGIAGSFIPIPGVGTLIGRGVGTAISNALEMEGVQGEDREFETAKKLVEVGGAAAQQVASMPPNAPPQAAVQAVRSAMQQHGIALPQGGQRHRLGGRWYRRGNRIVLVGV